MSLFFGFRFIWATLWYIFSSIIWCICISNRAKTVSSLAMRNVRLRNRNDFLLSAHALLFIVPRSQSERALLVFQMEHIFILRIFCVCSSYLHSMYECIEYIRKSIEHCALFFEWFEFVNIMTFVAFDDHEEFFSVVPFYWQKMKARERKREMNR